MTDKHQVDIRVDQTTLDTLISAKWVRSPETDPQLTLPGLNAMALMASYLSREIEDDTWQFHGMQAFMAVLLERMREYQEAPEPVLGDPDGSNRLVE